MISCFSALYRHQDFAEAAVRSALEKSRSENMQQIYRRTPIPLQIY